MNLQSDIASSLDTGLKARQAIRANQWQGPTSGLAPGFAQANLVVLAQDQAEDFKSFCDLNPKPCPLIQMLEPGCPFPDENIAKDCDLRSDLPRYRHYQRGEFHAEYTDLSELWQESWVSFLLGCSFSFEQALYKAGIPMRHIDQDQNVPMYNTTLPCQAVGDFQGTMVVSMRPIPEKLVSKVVEICRHFPLDHGEPLHIGEPEALGIACLDEPDYGQKVGFKSDDVPVFWACGVTPQAIACQAKIDFMITHVPGHMLLLDRKI